MNLNRTKVLIKARKLLKNGWCQFAGAKNAHSKPVSTSHIEATSYCIMGALSRACVGEYSDRESQRLAYLDLQENFRSVNDLKNIIHWNDDWDRTLEDVLDAFDKAIHESRWESCCEKEPVSLLLDETCVC